MIWRVVIADGTIDKYEERLAVQMKFRLQLTDEQPDCPHGGAILSRTRGRAGRGGGAD